jgi:peptide-methionine (S)-S-oxide reductase
MMQLLINLWVQQFCINLQPQRTVKMLNNFLAGLLLTISITGCAEQKAHNNFMSDKTANTNSLHSDTATFGAGCFWCVEAVFQRMKGVEKVVSGYSGGHVANPTYEQVCSKTTGHVEVARIIYNPAVVTYDELLEVFWKTHNPTTVDQQGNDKGPQYRSVVFYHNDEQKQKAEYYKKQLDSSGAWDKPIVTNIEPLTNFYAAEDYHQNYYNNNPDQMYCRYVVGPKVEKFEKVFKDKLKEGVK